MIFLLNAPSQGRNNKKNWKPKKEALYIYTKCENLQWFLQCGKVYMTFIEDSVIHKVDAIMPSLDWVLLLKSHSNYENILPEENLKRRVGFLFKLYQLYKF